MQSATTFPHSHWMTGPLVFPKYRSSTPCLLTLGYGGLLEHVCHVRGEREAMDEMKHLPEE